MISKFITIPRNVQFLTRCTSIAKFCTERKLPEVPLERSQGTVETKSEPDFRQKYTVEKNTETPLPEYPDIEQIKKLDVESFLRSNHHIVKYGDYEYTECKEGYVQVHILGYVNDRDPNNVTAGYGVCFGTKDNPLNFGGRVIGEATSRHAGLYACAKMLESLPTDSFKKICICTPEFSLMSTVARSMPKYAENNYYMLANPTRRCRNVQTLKKLNAYIRLHPFTYRMKYTPTDCGIPMMKIASKLAIAGASK